MTKHKKRTNMLAIGGMCLLLSSTSILGSIGGMHGYTKEGFNLSTTPTKVEAATYETNLLKKVSKGNKITYNTIKVSSDSLLERYIICNVLDGKTKVDMRVFATKANQLVYQDTVNEIMVNLQNSDFYKAFIKNFDVGKEDGRMVLTISYTGDSKKIPDYFKKTNSLLNTYAKKVKKEKTTELKYKKAYDILYKAKYKGDSTTSTLKNSYYYPLVKKQVYGDEGVNVAYKLIVERAGLSAKTPSGKADLPGAYFKIAKQGYYTNMYLAIYTRDKSGIPNTYGLLHETEYARALNGVSSTAVVTSKLDYYAKKKAVTSDFIGVIEKAAPSAKKAFKKKKGNKYLYMRLKTPIGEVSEGGKSEMDFVLYELEKITGIKKIGYNQDKYGLYIKAIYYYQK